MHDILNPARWSIHLYSLAFAITVYNMAVFQDPLIDYLGQVETSVLQVVSVQILQVCLFAAFLLLLASVSVRLMKLLAVVLLVTNAAALYFMHSYRIEIDLSMIKNILTTDTPQTLELWHWRFGLYAFFFGVAPALFICAMEVRKPRRIFRIATSTLIFVSFLGWALATAVTWPWYDRHATRMGARILPWSYVVNTARLFNQQASANRAQVLLPDASFLADPSAEKEIVVLVLGEAARAANFSLLGYERETNPFTAQTDLFALPVGQSCATYTIASTACVLTHEGRAASPNTVFEPLASYLTRHDVHTIWHTNNGGTPPFTANRVKHVRDLVAECVGDDCPVRRLDGALFHNLDQLILDTDADRIFIMLHQSGSHGPRYFQKYPAELEPFTPVCRTVQMRQCSYEELVNAYDNTIHYTDFLLADLIRQLQSIPNANAAMMYVSDHGQSLGENGLYLHGTPNVVAPAVQRDVPFLVWMSEGFKKARGIENADVMQAESFPHDFPFHSVMGVFGMRSDIYEPEFDIFSASTFDRSP